MATDAAVAAALANAAPQNNPVTNPAAMAKVARHAPHLHAQMQRIKAHPHLSKVAAGMAPGPTQADPTGTNLAGQPGRLGWGNEKALRLPKVRHVLLGFTALTLAAAGTGQAVATPNVSFKPNRFVSAPSVLFAGTVAQMQSGIRPQFVTLAGEDLDMYQPLSYGSEVDLDPVKAAVNINAQITSSAGGTTTFYGALVGVAIGQQYRKQTSKLMNGSLGTSGSVSANGTGSLTLTPLVGYTARKVLFTPGSAFSDYFIITSITAGIQNQLMSTAPIPASVFNDLYPLFVDFDQVTAAVPLTIGYQNVAASAGTLKGSTRGDCDAAALAKYADNDMGDIAA